MPSPRGRRVRRAAQRPRQKCEAKHPGAPALAGSRRSVVVGAGRASLGGDRRHDKEPIQCGYVVGAQTRVAVANETLCWSRRYATSEHDSQLHYHCIATDGCGRSVTRRHDGMHATFRRKCLNPGVGPTAVRGRPGERHVLPACTTWTRMEDGSWELEMPWEIRTGLHHGLHSLVCAARVRLEVC